MSTQFNQSNIAIVGQSENLDWFDTVPEGWTDLGQRYDTLIVGEPLSVK